MGSSLHPQSMNLFPSVKSPKLAKLIAQCSNASLLFCQCVIPSGAEPILSEARAELREETFSNWHGQILEHSVWQNWSQKSAISAANFMKWPKILHAGKKNQPFALEMTKLLGSYFVAQCAPSHYFFVCWQIFNFFPKAKRIKYPMSGVPRACSSSHAGLSKITTVSLWTDFQNSFFPSKLLKRRINFLYFLPALEPTAPVGTLPKFTLDI